MKGKVTAFDVAARAGVSQPTVSRALRDHVGVSPETRKRVREAAEQLGYCPDRRAVSLRSGRTNRIAVVILSAPADARLAANSFYMMLLSHVANAAALRGYEIIVSFQHSAASFQARYQQEGEADGIIVIGASSNVAGWKHFAEAHRGGANVVCWGSPDDAIPTFRCDNRAAAASAVEHLIVGGRRRIAFLGPGWRRHRAYEDRRSGYTEVVRRHRLPIHEAPRVKALTREAEGFAATRLLIEKTPDIDAIFAASDLLAMGAFRALAACGRSVPGDVAVVGFDGIPQAPHLSPSLTTIEQDAVAAGFYMVDALLAVGSEPLAGTREVPTRLVERESSRPADRV